MCVYRGACLCVCVSRTSVSVFSSGFIFQNCESMSLMTAITSLQTARLVTFVGQYERVQGVWTDLHVLIARLK